VYFGWHLFSDLNSFGLVLDDISVTQTTTTVCDTSLTLTAGGVTQSSATINWSAVTGSNGYQYVLDQTAALPTGPGTNTTALTYPATGLLPNTTYYFHLRTVCGTSFSAWKTVSFTTAPVSVNNVAANNISIAVYPNPVKNTAVVELSEVGEHATLQITDLSGKVMQTITVSSKRTEADMSTFAPGIYLLRYSDDTRNQVMKVVKQ
jgi:hypothetical protein